MSIDIQWSKLLMNTAIFHNLNHCVLYKLFICFDPKSLVLIMTLQMSSVMQKCVFKK